MNLGGTIHINKTRFGLLLFLATILLVYISSRQYRQRADVLNEVNLRKLLAVTILAVQYGGKEVIENVNSLKIKSKGKTKEGANDSVTTADFKSHCAMTNILGRNFPTLRVVSEESKTSCDEHNYSTFNDSYPALDNDLKDEWIDEKVITVWIDPLDATQEYTEKLYRYVTVMACVAIQGKPTIGIIHKPFLNYTTWAWVNKGYSLNLDRKKVHLDTTMRIIVSRSHAGKVKDVIQKMFGNKDVKIINAGGAGYKVLEVTSNNADVYLHVTAIKKWDICAGNAILNAFGGKMVTKYNRQIDYTDSGSPVNEDGLVASLNARISFENL